MIATERFILRPPGYGDVEDINSYAGDPAIDMMIYLPHETMEDTRKFVEYAVSEWEKEEPEDREYVILYQGKIIGGVNLEYCGEKTYEIGWIVHRDCRDMGAAAEAAEALMDYAFSVLGAAAVRAHCDCRNAASEKVMKKLGMTLKDDRGTRFYEKTGVTAGEYLYMITEPEFREKSRQKVL